MSRTRCVVVLCALAAFLSCGAQARAVILAREANRAYHGPGPYLARLIFTYIPDLTVLLTQLKAGESEGPGLQGIPVDRYPEAK